MLGNIFSFYCLAFSFMKLILLIGLSCCLDNLSQIQLTKAHQVKITAVLGTHLSVWVCVCVCVLAYILYIGMSLLRMCVSV